MNSKLLIGLVVLIAGVGVGWYILKGAVPSQSDRMTPTTTDVPSPTPELETLTQPQSTQSSGTSQDMEKGGVSKEASMGTTMTVTYADSGFSPQTITVKKGTTVTFANSAGTGMRVASALHPTHQLLPGFDQLKSAGKGGTYEYTFTKVGTWKYHNHMNASDTGSVVVTE